MIDTPRPRRIVIVRDTCSPLWVVRCETPCRPDGRWCQGHDLTPPRAICWLGAGMNVDSMRARWGADPAYEVVA